MLDHFGFKVSDIARSRAFYDAVLAPLGYGLVMEVTPAMTGNGSEHLGYGPTGKPAFWIGTGGEATRNGLHVALTAPNRAAVDAFYQAAIANGAKDNGPPGLRPHYHETYYGAFVIDPDGHNLEAVTHRPE